MSRRRNEWAETLEIDAPLATCGGCGFTSRLDGTWSVEDGRLVFRAALNPLVRRGPSLDSCCESDHDGRGGTVAFRRITVDGKLLTDEQAAILRASAESPDAWDEEAAGL